MPERRYGAHFRDGARDHTPAGSKRSGLILCEGVAQDRQLARPAVVSAFGISLEIMSIAVDDLTKLFLSLVLGGLIG